METTNKLPKIFSDPSLLSVKRGLLMPVIFQVPYRTHCLDGTITETLQALYCSVLLFM
jgi:hypothetical protein